MAASRLLTQDKKIAQIYDERHHLRHPIPLSMELIPIGKTITEYEWGKFCKHLNHKEIQGCERKKNGTVVFIGEGGLDSAKQFQNKFNSRFHFRLVCASEPWAKDGVKLAIEKGVEIRELYFKNPDHTTTMINDQDTILRLVTVH